MDNPLILRDFYLSINSLKKKNKSGVFEKVTLQASVLMEVWKA